MAVDGHGSAEGNLARLMGESLECRSLEQILRSHEAKRKGKHACVAEGDCLSVIGASVSKVPHSRARLHLPIGLTLLAMPGRERSELSPSMWEAVTECLEQARTGMFSLLSSRDVQPLPQSLVQRFLCAIQDSVRSACDGAVSAAARTAVLQRISIVCTLLLLPEKVSSSEHEAEPPLAAVPLPALAPFLSEVLIPVLRLPDAGDGAWLLINTCLRVWQAAIARVRLSRSSFDAFVERLFPCVAVAAYRADESSTTPTTRTSQQHVGGIGALAQSVLRQSLFGSLLVRDFPAAFSDSVVHTQLALAEMEGQQPPGLATDAPSAKRHRADKRSELYDPPVSSFHRRLWESLRLGTASPSGEEATLPRELCRRSFLSIVPSLLEEFIRAWHKAFTASDSNNSGGDSRRRKKRRRELRDAEVGVDRAAMTSVAVDTVGVSVFVPPPELGFALELVIATCPSLRTPVEEARRSKTRFPTRDAAASLLPEEWQMLHRWLHVVRSHKLYRPQDDVAPHPQQQALRRVVASLLAAPVDDGAASVVPEMEKPVGTPGMVSSWCRAITNATAISHRLVEPHFRAILASIPLLLSGAAPEDFSERQAAEETSVQLLRTWQSLRQAPTFVASLMESLDTIQHKSGTADTVIHVARDVWLAPRIRQAWRDAICKAPEGQLYETLLPPLRLLRTALPRDNGVDVSGDDGRKLKPGEGKKRSGRSKRPRSSSSEPAAVATVSVSETLVLEIAAYWLADGIRMTPVRPSNAATILQRSLMIARHVATLYLRWALTCRSEAARCALLSAGWELLGASVDAACATQPFLLARAPLGVGCLLQEWDESIDTPVTATWAASRGDGLHADAEADTVITEFSNESVDEKAGQLLSWESVVNDTVATLEALRTSGEPTSMSVVCHLAEAIATSLAQRLRLWIAADRSHLSVGDEERASPQHGQRVANALLRLLRAAADNSRLQEVRVAILSRLEPVLPLVAQTATASDLAETLVTHPDLWDSEWLLEASNDAELLEGVEETGLRQRLAESLVRLVARRMLATDMETLKRPLRTLADATAAFDESAVASLSSAVEPLWCEPSESPVASVEDGAAKAVGPLVELLAQSSGFLWTKRASASAMVHNAQEEPSRSGRALYWLISGCLAHSGATPNALPFWRALDCLLRRVPALLLQQSVAVVRALGVRLASVGAQRGESLPLRQTALIQWAASLLTAADAHSREAGAKESRMRFFGEGVRLGAGAAIDVWLAALWGSLTAISPGANEGPAAVAHRVGLTHKSGKLRSWAVPDRSVDELAQDRPVSEGVVWLAAADLQCRARLGMHVDGKTGDAQMNLIPAAQTALRLLARAAVEANMSAPFQSPAALLDSVIGRVSLSDSSSDADAVRSEWATLSLEWLAREITMQGSVDARPMETSLQRWMLSGSRWWIEALLRHVEAQLVRCGTDQWEEAAPRDATLAACARTVRVFLETAPSAKPSGVKALLSHWALALLVSGRAAMSQIDAGWSPHILCDWMAGAASVLARPRLLPMTARDVAAVLGWLDPLVRAAAERGAGLPGQWRAKSGGALRRKGRDRDPVLSRDDDQGSIVATAGAHVVYTLIRHRRVLVTPLVGTLTSVLVSLTSVVLEDVASRSTRPSSATAAKPSSSSEPPGALGHVPVDALVRVWQETARVFRSKTAASASEAAEAKNQGPAVGVRGGRKWVARASCRSVGRILLGEWAHRSGSLLRAGIVVRDKLRPGLFALFSMVTEQDVQDLFVHLQGLPHAQAALQETHRLWEEEHEAEIMAGKDI